MQKCLKGHAPKDVARQLGLVDDDLYVWLERYKHHTSNTLISSLDEWRIPLDFFNPTIIIPLDFFKNIAFIRLYFFKTLAYLANYLYLCSDFCVIHNTLTTELCSLQGTKYK